MNNNKNKRPPFFPGKDKDTEPSPTPTPTPSPSPEPVPSPEPELTPAPVLEIKPSKPEETELPAEETEAPAESEEPVEGEEAAAADAPAEGEDPDASEVPVEEGPDAEDLLTKETEETQELIEELPVDDEEKEEGPGFMFWGSLVLAFVLGGLICAMIFKLISKKRRMPPVKASHIKGLAVQGIGKRKDQQDALFYTDTSLYAKQGVVMCVADGMGGLSNGSMFSSTAVSAVASKLPGCDTSNPEKLVAALTQAAVAAVNRVISPNFGSGGTTLLIGYLRDGKFYYSSVGDSRICLYRDGALFTLNRPHDYEGELMVRHINNEMGFENVKTFEKRAALTSYLGMGSIRYLDMPDSPVPVRRGDRIVLMSDGVFNTLNDEEIAAVLRLSPKNIEKALGQAVEAKQNRYQDNYTAVILAIE